MIVLDTNVLSEFMRARPNPAVMRWMDRQTPEAVWTTSITIMEAQSGIELMAGGRRQRALAVALERLIVEVLQNRVLPFDHAAAKQAAMLISARRRNGRNQDFRDTQIASVVLARGALLATRNIGHFIDLGDSVINPWDCP